MFSRLRRLIFLRRADRALGAALLQAVETELDDRFGEPVAWRGAARDRSGETSLSFARPDGSTLRLRLADRDARSLRAALFDLQRRTRSHSDKSSGRLTAPSVKPQGPPPPKKS